jgi:methylenetetrahydrofolate dehydrogenase (NADP+) / methenyltetrahydrofolate cyclohydrolase
MILDGSRLARERAPGLLRRARAVIARRGSPPRLVIVAFGADGRAPHVSAKVRACAAAGVEAVPVVIDDRLPTPQAIATILQARADARADGIFLQFPFPDQVDEAALTAAIPPDADVDVMAPLSIRRFLELPDALPPVTVSAVLALLAAGDIAVSGLRGVIVAPESAFAHMFRTALLRAGADMAPLIDPDASDPGARVAQAELIVAAAARPGLLCSRQLPAGAVVIDAGYYNPGGRGDIDTAGGTAHLRALAPVPGGVGPMTVSCLIERTILYAEAGAP